MSRLVWKCPVCGKVLSEIPEERRFVCPGRHSFDVAREGYVNLNMGSGSARSGDDADMVRARTRFLSAGYYQPFSDGVNDLCAQVLSDIPSPAAADAGCGEGYYTNRLADFFRKKGADLHCAGFDLSKRAVAHGAKAARAAGLPVSYAVASLFAMPLMEESCDLVLNLFAPTADEEFARILRPGGALMLAVPGERHLFGLKQALYDAPYENELRRDELPHFKLTDIRRVEHVVTVRSKEDITALFAMTPYFWKTSPGDRAKLSTLDSLETETVFDLLLYRKK